MKTKGNPIHLAAPPVPGQKRKMTRCYQPQERRRVARSLGEVPSLEEMAPAAVCEECLKAVNHPAQDATERLLDQIFEVRLKRIVTAINIGSPKTIWLSNEQMKRAVTELRAIDQEDREEL